jgi:hypothetical protein
MTESMAGASLLLSALAEHREAMISLAVDLRRRRQVAEVTTGIDIRKYESGEIRVESYVDAELRDGRALCWWLEMSSADPARWTIGASLRENNASGQDVLRDFGELAGNSPAGLASGLDRLTRELAAATDIVHER